MCISLLGAWEGGGGQDGGELDRDVLFWRKPAGRVTSEGARRESSVGAYLGQDKPRGWRWLPSAVGVGTDHVLWFCWWSGVVVLLVLPRLCFQRCSAPCGITRLLCFDFYVWNTLLKNLVADYAKYLLFITMSYCVNAVLSLQDGFNMSWILYVNCFRFSIASSLGHFNLIIVTVALLWNVLCPFWFFFSISFKYLAA